MKDLGDRIKFTGIIVTHNDARYLRDCLKSLTFCEQLIVIDLGSTDSSIEIAKECGAEIKYHDWVPIVEQIRDEAVNYSRNDWVIFLDPDEIFPANVESDLRSLITKNRNLGIIKIPWQFYFRGRPLHFTFWGMKKAKEIVLHKHRNRFNNHVHKGIQPLERYCSASLSRRPNHVIKHYWMVSYRDLFEKHWRYIKKEGQARYEQGERFSYPMWFRETIGALKYSLIKCRGIRGGFVGIFLSFFYSGYISMSLLSLYRYQKLERGKKP